jgi:PRC-barrel domain
MLRNSSFVIGRSVQATDGPIGTVTDLLFDDSSWNVRWAVIDTGSWLTGRRVLLPPQRLSPAPGDPERFTVPLTCEQVKASPSEDSDMPVSRRHEFQLFSYYQWDPYWLGGAAFGGALPLIQPLVDDPGLVDGDEHLRSTVRFKDYIVQATDGDIGHIADILIDPERWSIPLLEIATRNWLPGRKVLLAPALVEKIDWFERAVSFRRTRAEIPASPEYDPSVTIDRDRLRQLYDHYGLPTDRI